MYSCVHRSPGWPRLLFGRHVSLAVLEPAAPRSCELLHVFHSEVQAEGRNYLRHILFMEDHCVTKPRKTFKASACCFFANIPLAKGHHMAKSHTSDAGGGSVPRA